ncbi:MAG: mechanosensitive ion channel, partial [Flavobacteriales bacterium]|nr:mechanosensitive ion channel [Flavobacteriales bacterium]
MTEELKSTFISYYDGLVAALPKLATALIVFLVFVVLGKLFYRFIGKRIQRRWKDSIVSQFLAVTTKYAFYAFGFVFALNVMGFSNMAGGLVAGAGVGAIIVGFAFKDIGENFLAGFLLSMSRPFNIGDIIEVEGYKGTVKALDLRTTHIRNVEGKDIFLPNAMIVKNTVINFSKDGYLRVEFLVGID